MVKGLRDANQLTIYGIEKLKQKQVVPAKVQNLHTKTLIKKDNAHNPQGTIQSQKPTSAHENKRELPSESVSWTAEKLPPNPAPAPVVESIDLSAISPSKLARLALLDSMKI